MLIKSGKAIRASSADPIFCGTPLMVNASRPDCDLLVPSAQHRLGVAFEIAEERGDRRQQMTGLLGRAPDLEAAVHLRQARLEPAFPI